MDLVYPDFPFQSIPLIKDSPREICFEGSQNSRRGFEFDEAQIDQACHARPDDAFSVERGNNGKVQHGIGCISAIRH